jgi:hypothetical protein
MEIPEISTILSIQEMKATTPLHCANTINTKNQCNNSNNSNYNLFITPQSTLSELFIHNEKTVLYLTDRLLQELMNIKHILKRSSYEIQQIFQYPLKLLNRKYSICKIQMEAFHSILLNDERIRKHMNIIKNTFFKRSTKKLMHLISIIEDDRNYAYNELTLLNKELNDKMNKNKPTFTSNIEYQGYYSITSNCKASAKCSKMKKGEKINKDNAIQVEALTSGNIDDIMKYICSDDHKKKKKKKNKNKCNNNNNNSSNIYNDNCIQHIYGNVNNNNNDDDIMVINFKNSLLNNSFKAYQYNKIIPSLSEGWLYSLNNNTNNILLNNIINNNTHDTNTTNLI